MKKFREVLKEARKKKKLTLRRLGELTGISPSYLSEIETGAKLPPKDTNKLKQLAEALGLDLTYLIKISRNDRIAGKLNKIVFSSIDSLAYSLFREDQIEERADKEDLERLKKMLEETIRKWEDSKKNA